MVGIQVIAMVAVLSVALAMNVVGMDATQFQAAFLAWASAATVCIAALVALGIALIKGIHSLQAALHTTDTAVAAVTATTATHERQLNGDMTPRIEAVVDSRISQHRRPGDTPAK